MQELWRKRLMQANDPKSLRFEFKIDGEVLFAPREAMTAPELIDIALAAKVLDPVEGGYNLEDGKGNVLNQMM